MIIERFAGQHQKKLEIHENVEALSLLNNNGLGRWLKRLQPYKLVKVPGNSKRIVYHLQTINSDMWSVSLNAHLIQKILIEDKTIQNICMYK